MIRRLQARFGGGMGGGGRGTGSGSGGSFFSLTLVLTIGLLVWLAWPGVGGYYVAEANQQGVILRFGKFHRVEPAGFHFKLPFPIEQRLTPETESNIETPIVGSVSSGALMLTGDENIVELQFSVQWEVGNDEGEVFDHLFRINEPTEALVSVAESAMREVIGRTDLQSILQNDESIKREVEAILQSTLDEYQAGIDVREVVINRPSLPTTSVEVDALDDLGRPIEIAGGRQTTRVTPQEAYEDVRNARSEAARRVEDANAYANRVVPDARGDAARVEAGANAYADAIVREARGRADRFLAIYEQYAASLESQDVLRTQYHRETLERVLSQAELTILDGEAGSGAVPYISLNELSRSSGAGGR